MPGPQLNRATIHASGLRCTNWFTLFPVVLTPKLCHKYHAQVASGLRLSDLSVRDEVSPTCIGSNSAFSSQTLKHIYDALVLVRVSRKYIGPFESSQAVVATKKAHGASSTTAEEHVLQGKAERNGASIQVVGITALWRLECHHGNPRRWFGHSRRAEGQRAIFTRQPVIGQPKANCSREAQDEFHIRYGCHYRVVVFPGHGAISTSQACNSSVSLAIHDTLSDLVGPVNILTINF
ncbi:hypothetical protein DER44DRAFT_868660 [Fusarium oxysporum]|nr:hypothetical protein DER44DRAFT_868660 [Fusarium oxysporum]